MNGPAARREYFYAIDRDGVLYHDGTVLSDERFLRFFFRRLVPNETGRHPEFPFVSPCGNEMNYVRAEESVIVFRRLTRDGELEYNAGLGVPFEPAELRVSAAGRLYHSAPVGGVGLLRSSLVVQLAEHVEERDGAFVFARGSESWPIRPLTPSSGTPPPSA